MPINAKFQYRGQPWAPWANTVCQIAAVAMFIQARPMTYWLLGAITLTQLGMIAMWYRAEKKASTFQGELENETAANIGLAIYKSNLGELKLKDRKMPSEILEEAVSGVQEES